MAGHHLGVRTAGYCNYDERKVKGALLLGIVTSTFFAVILNYLTGLSAFPEAGKAVIPKSVFSAPIYLPLESSIFLPLQNWDFSLP